MTPRLPTRALEDAIERTPEAPALATADATWTYRRLGLEVAARARRELGDLAPGSRVGVEIVPGAPSSVALLWAAWRLGLTVLPLSRRDAETPARRAVAGRHGLDAVIVDQGPAESDGAEPEWPHPVATGVLCLIPTSGSTGGPKLVCLTHGNVAAAVESSSRLLGNGQRDTWLLCLPLTHVAGLSILWRSAATGGAVRLVAGFEASGVAAILTRGEASWVSLVPTMLRRLLAADAGPYPATLAGVLVGGAAVDEALVLRALAAGLPVLSSYGMTEACSQIATVAPGEAADSIGSVGRPVPGMSVEVVGPGGAVEDGVEGDIYVDGPAVSPGYDRAPPRVSPLRTGDRGYLDGGGRLVVVGRGDDVIVTGGENVQPALVEAAITSHPGVRLAAVFGAPDVEWGEVVVASVVAPGESAASLEEHVRARLRRFEVPRRWVFLDHLPVLANGKVDKASLRRRLAP